MSDALQKARDTFRPLREVEQSDNAEDIWQAFERVLKEHGAIEQETPEEAARRYGTITWKRSDGSDGELPDERKIEHFLAGVEWARQNPAALVNRSAKQEES